MDPMNNQIPTPNPAPVSPTPVPPVAPVAPVEPAAPAAPVAPVPPVAPTAPVAPVAPEVPVVPEAPAAPVAPATPDSAPVVNPGQGAINPAMNSMFVQGGGLVGATDPITMPTPPKAPDPVEEELKAPFKAAGPVPGSIGSAISVPAGEDAPAPEPGRAPNNVSFNDPAMANNPAPMAAGAPAKKKVSKNTLIALAAVLGVAVIGLAIYLVITLMQGK